MWYLTYRLHKVGITANRPLEVIEQALLIDSGAALETAIFISLTGISWAIDHQLEHADKQTIKETKQQFIQEFLAKPQVVKAKFRLKQLAHEGA